MWLTHAQSKIQGTVDIELDRQTCKEGQTRKACGVVDMMQRTACGHKTLPREKACSSTGMPSMLMGSQVAYSVKVHAPGAVPLCRDE